MKENDRLFFRQFQQKQGHDADDDRLGVRSEKQGAGRKGIPGGRGKDNE